MGVLGALGIALIGGVVVLGLGAALYFLIVRRAARPPVRLDPELFDSLPIALALRNREGRYLFVNKTWERWFGGLRDRVLNTSVRDFTDTDTAERVLALDAEAFERGRFAPPLVSDFVLQDRRYTQTRTLMTDERNNVIGVLVASMETTESHTQERQLRDQMALTKALIDENPNSMYLKDKDGRYVTVNDAFLKAVGRKREEIVGRTVTDIWDDAEARRIYAEDRRLLSEGQGSSEMESLRLGRDGKSRWIIVRKSVLRNADGEVTGLIGANTDVTRLKQAEEALLDEQRRLGLVVRAAKVGIVDWDGFSHQTYYSPRFREILGYAPDADTSQWPDYFKVLLHPDDREAYTKKWQAFIRGKSALGPRAEFLGPDEHRLLRKDGSYVWVEVSGVAVRNAEGFVTRWIAATTDITERRSQEAELEDRGRQFAEQKQILETTLENIDQGISMIDKDLRIIAFNWRFLELLDLPAELFAHRPTLEQVFRFNARRGEYGSGDPEEQVASRMALTRKFEPHSFERKRPNGQVLAIRGQPLPGNTGFVTTYTDVTEQKRAEEELKTSVRLREEVERMSRHDLKTPINSVIAVSRMLRENAHLADEDAELLATVERAGYRILNMVNLSLDLFRMEQGTYEFRPQPVDLDEVAAKVASDLQSQAASKDVEVRVRRGKVAIARAEELLCYSMFANLVKNAIEAAPEGTQVTIEIDQEGDAAIARVHNAGAVPETVRARFFQKYATAGKSAGLGLGAYSAHLMARVQQGELTLATSAAEGTTLTVRLQAAHGEMAAAMREATTASAEAPLPELPPLRVLIADDDEFNRLVLRRYLPSPPLKVSVAVNGRAALDAADDEWPDVVLLDLEMPVMDGYEAARRLREVERNRRRKRCMIVAISSNDEAAIVKRALAAGCDHYLVKPAQRETLWRLLAGATVPLASGGSPVGDVEGSDPVELDPDLEATLEDFLASRRDALEEMPRTLGAGDRATFKRLAHRLAGSFALYGFRWASARAKSIERDADEGAEADLATRVAELRAHLDNVRVVVPAKKAVTP